MAGDGGKTAHRAGPAEPAAGEVGITPGDEVVAYCRSGVRASLAYLSMQQVGYDIRLYDGSYSEWMDSGNSVEV